MRRTIKIAMRIAAIIAAAQLLGLPDCSGRTFGVALLVGMVGLLWLAIFTLADKEDLK